MVPRFLSAKVSLVRVAMEHLCSASPSRGHPPLLSSLSVWVSVDGAAHENQGRHALKTGDLLGRLFWLLALLCCISGSAAQKSNSHAEGSELASVFSQSLASKPLGELDLVAREASLLPPGLRELAANHAASSKGCDSLGTGIQGPSTEIPRVWDLLALAGPQCTSKLKAVMSRVPHSSVFTYVASAAACKKM